MKVYTIVCVYILDNGPIKIELSRMLKRLNLLPKKLIYEGIEYGVDYRAKDVVKYNFDKGYKVKYELSIKKLGKRKEIFEYNKITNEVIKFVENLNNEHENLMSNLTDMEFELKYRYYGNDYSKQTKRRI